MLWIAWGGLLSPFVIGAIGMIWAARGVVSRVDTATSAVNNLARQMERYNVINDKRLSSLESNQLKVVDRLSHIEGELSIAQANR